MSAWISRYRFHLESIPELLAAARGRVVPTGAQRFDNTRTTGGGKDGYVPFREDAVDDADLLWSLLVLYAQEAAELVGGAPPAGLRSGWSTSQEVQGVRASTSAAAPGIARLIVRWLVDRGEAIGPHAQLEPTEEQLFTLIRGLRAKYGIEERARGPRSRRCAVCGDRAVVAVYANTLDGREASLVRCGNCGASGKEAVYGPEDADLLAGSETSPPVGHDDQAVAATRDADGS